LTDQSDKWIDDEGLDGSKFNCRTTLIAHTTQEGATQFGGSSVTQIDLSLDRPATVVVVLTLSWLSPIVDPSGGKSHAKRV
jgi:hypothetical protein